MAHPEDDDWQDRAPDVGRAAPSVVPGRLINAVALGASLVLLIWLGWWGYRLAMRDVRGVPVVQAMPGPLRVAPDNPGGEVSENQGLAVNSIAAGAGAQATPDTLVLAPPPVDLAPGDVGSAPGAAPTIAAVPDDAPADMAVAQDVPTDPLADIPPAPDAVPEPVPPAPSAPPVVVDQNAVAAALMSEAPSEAGDAAEPMTARPALRPRPRPADLGAAPAPVAATAPVEIDPSQIAPGTRMVQLGAFDTADQARGEWARLRARFAEDFADKSLVVQSAVSGGRTFYRLRATGFADAAAARDFCNTLLQQGAPCIPATQR